MRWGKSRFTVVNKQTHRLHSCIVIYYVLFSIWTKVNFRPTLCFFPSTVLAIGDTALHEIDKNSCPCETSQQIKKVCWMSYKLMCRNNFRDRSSGTAVAVARGCTGSWKAKASMMSDTGAERMSPGQAGRQERPFKQREWNMQRPGRRRSQRWKIVSPRNGGTTWGFWTELCQGLSPF